MEVSKPIELARVDELKILQNVRLVKRIDLNPVKSSENLSVQFSVSGEITGNISCYLCLDGHALTSSEKNLLFPLFVESMNILIGRQMSFDKGLSGFRFKLGAPKLSMVPREINTRLRALTSEYTLELDHKSLTVLTEVSLTTLN
ncbi:MAG TPA: hypothetical protein VNJ01_12450 [Bacteriovoracaceae bacterium]|nr:hypothetical protein [Bacteriovoracaceae bacterium]